VEQTFKIVIINSYLHVHSSVSLNCLQLTTHFKHGQKLKNTFSFAFLQMVTMNLGRKAKGANAPIDFDNFSKNRLFS